MCCTCRPLGAEARPPSLLLVALLGLCACDKSGLASLSNREVRIALGGDRLNLEITYAAGGEEDLHCATLRDFKDFRCTIDGISLDVVSPGSCHRQQPDQGYSFPLLTPSRRTAPERRCGQSSHFG